MEADIYTGLQTLIQAKASYFQTHGHTPVVHFDWFKDQIDQALAPEAEGNQGLAWLRPALLVEFSPTVYTGNNGGSKQGSGTLTLRLVQDALAFNSERGSASQAQFVARLDYATRLVDVLDMAVVDGCAVKLVHTGTRRDHSNRVCYCPAPRTQRADGTFALCASPSRGNSSLPPHLPTQRHITTCMRNKSGSKGNVP